MVALYGREPPKMLLDRAALANEHGDEIQGASMARDRGHRSAARPKPAVAR